MEAWIWLGLMVVFIFVEAATVATVSLWFAGGALVSMVAALLHVSVPVQVVLFFVVSGTLLASLRPVLQRYFVPKLKKTNIDAVIGASGLVTEDIDNIQGKGKVKVGAMDWTARSTDDSMISAGTQIRVDRIEGVKVFVSPVKETVKLN